MQQKTALVIGATGLIGRSLVFELLKSPTYKHVLVFSRKDMVIKHQKFTQILIDFDHLDKYSDQILANDIFCCLGSTKSKTPDLEIYKKIDFEYPLQVAKLAKKHGADQFILISSMSANPNSSIFYSKIKGEVEEAIANVKFQSLIILRPSLLLGSRSESRPFETISQYFMRVLNPLFLGPLKAFKAIQGMEVAKAMVLLANQNNRGTKIVSNQQIFETLEIEASIKRK